MSRLVPQPTLELLELERIWPERYRPKPLLKQCRAVCAGTGLRCKKFEHTGKHRHERGEFSVVLKPGEAPSLLTLLEAAATSQREPLIHATPVTESLAAKRESARKYRAKRRLVIDRSGAPRR